MNYLHLCRISSISGDFKSISLSKVELPSMTMVSIATRVSTTLWIYVPVFSPLIFPVMCRFVFDSFYYMMLKAIGNECKQWFFIGLKFCCKIKKILLKVYSLN
jgi:hypothetical protein